MPSIILHYATPAGVQTKTTLTINAIKGYDKADAMDLFPRLKHEYLDGALSTHFKRFGRRITVDFGVIQTDATKVNILNFMLDNERAIEYNQLQIQDEGTFEDPAPWTFGTGWAHDAINEEADHTAGNTADLEETPTTALVNGATYYLSFQIKNRTAGGVTPKIGGTSGVERLGNTTHVQLIKAGSGSLLEFTPSSAFDGSIDNVILNRVCAVVPENPDGYEFEWIENLQLGSRLVLTFQENVKYADPASVYA